MYYDCFALLFLIYYCTLLFFLISYANLFVSASVLYFQTCLMCSPLLDGISISLTTPVTLDGKSRQTLFANCRFMNLHIISV